MSYVDFYLKASTQGELEAALPEAVDGALDIVGVIEGVDGYHANLRLREGVNVPDSLKPFLIGTPANPVRVWA